MNEDEFIMMLEEKGMVVEMDGAALGIHGPNFDNPAVSPMGFGENVFEAVAAFLGNLHEEQLI